MNPAIRIEKLGKRYRLGETGTGTLAHDLNRWWASIRGKENPYGKIGSLQPDKSGADIWALKDINLEIREGEVLGVIGKNGAGKSTLLKILSKVTKPTVGRILRKGRMASLLEVGTGFHPDLTGRENVFLNGAIMGMSGREIRSRFDEIVDFAGVERYINTPVKRYSSGMYVRLAFAVAAHLEAEILLVDEVLAVGDIEFQKKCLGKMGEVSRQSGKTILFVSHNMGSIELLCQKCLLLHEGQIHRDGPAKAVIKEYFRMNQGEFKGLKVNALKPIYFEDISVSDESGNRKAVFTTDETITINMRIKLNQYIPQTNVLLFLKNVSGQRLFMIETPLSDIFQEHTHSSEVKNMKISLDHNFLMPGCYSFELGILSALAEYLDYHNDASFFEVIYGKTGLVKYGSRELGFIFPKYNLIINN